MMKRFLTSLVGFLLMFTLVSAEAHASGKMEVELNKRIQIAGESKNPGATYKWVIQKGKEILATQSNRVLQYTFLQPGEYTLNLTAISPGNIVETTTVRVMVGQKYSRISEVTDVSGETLKPGLNLKLSTLPPLGSDSRIHLIGDSKVSFNLTGSAGEITEYRIDRNIFEDSDGNGKANDDIDNANDNSYLLGGLFATDYKSGEAAKITAEITLVDKEGKKARKQIEIVFDPAPKREGAPMAVLDVSPAADSTDRYVHLYGESADVSFYAKKSQGNILEYRIDKNIFEDTNGDGNPSNDIDNLNDPSFKTGDVFTVTYPKTDEQVIAQLVVVGEGGKGSRIQVGIRFDAQPPVTILETPSTPKIGLTSDKPFVYLGTPVIFSVEGLSQALSSYSFDWDFNGDGTVDQTTDGANTVQYIFDSPNTYNVTVVVTDQEGNTGKFNLQYQVREGTPTQADFTFEISEATVTFKDASTVSSGLANPTLQYQWSFGDNDEANFTAQKNQVGVASPVYTYKTSGTYLVTLTVTDADKVISTKSQEVAITTAATSSESTSPSSEGKSLFQLILKVLLYIVLFVIGFIGVTVGSALTFMKIKHPDLSLDEIIEELKHKILGALGVHEPEDIPPTPVSQPSAPAPAPAPAPTPAPGPATPTTPAPPVIDAHAEEKKGPVPDWLKGA